MATKRLDGTLFEKMLKNALNNIRVHEKEVNNLNVFPVPDGDTGINMRLTLENGVNSAPSDKNLGKYLKDVSSGMLLGARGNSGVILSQLFKGLYLSMSRYSVANPGELAEAFVKAYVTAYEAVVQPVEGTILTVAREGIERIKRQVKGNIDVETLLSMYLSEMRKSLAYTPEKLPVLKEAGVVDSGGTGYVYIIEGMLKYLRGETVAYTAPSEDEQLPMSAATAPVSLQYFNADSDFTFGYCMEFILQLMNGENYSQNFVLDSFIDRLKTQGDSLVALQEESRVKVHIHTLKPANVISLAQSYGEFVTFKLENMQLQHNEHVTTKPKAIHKNVAFVVVANGHGMIKVFKDLGCDVVIDGGPMMNTSSQEFVSVYRQLDAEHIIVIPNNKNVVGAALQAATLAGLNNVTVLPTKNMAQGYFAKAMDLGDDDDFQTRLDGMRQGGESAQTIAISIASRDFSGAVSCKKGDYIALLNERPICSSPDFRDTLCEALRCVPDIDEKENGIIFKGQSVSTQTEETVRHVLDESYPDIDCEHIDGGQGIFVYIIGF